MNRRHFVGTLSGAALISALPLSAQANAEKRNRALARLACNNWPFRAYFENAGTRHYRDPKYPLLHQVDFPQFLADHFGLRSVEFLAPYFDETTPTYIATIKEGLRKARCSVANLGDVSVPGGLYNPGLDRKQAVAHVAQWIDIAGLLGSPSIKIDLTGPKPYDTTIAADNVMPIVSYARSKHIRVLFHNDDIQRESADKLLGIIQRVRSRYLGTCPDFGNFATRSPQYALETLRRLMPYATNICHAKDGIAEGQRFYPDDFTASMKLTETVGFRGKYSLEFEGLEEPIPGVQALLEKTVALL
jgi:sugar phosphate isomerase/epimerase